MKKHLILLLSLQILTLVSFAQDKIAKGTKVKILEIGKSDDYFAEKGDFVGKDATASSELTKNSEGFYSGTLDVSTGRTCYFTSIKISKQGSTSTTQSASSTTISQESNFITGTIDKGTPVYVADISPDDSYYSNRKDHIGKKGKPNGEDLTMGSDGYYSGSFKYDDGTTSYFYKAKFSKEAPSGVKNTSTASATKPTTSISTSASKQSSSVVYITGIIKQGTPVYVADISSEDSYYSDRKDHIGKKGKPNKGDLSMGSDGYYSGDFKYDDGSTAYFYKAKFSKNPVSVVSTSSTTTTTSDDWYAEWDNADYDEDIKPGDRVKITAISPDDSLHDNKKLYIGKTGKVGDDIEFYDDYPDVGYGGTVILNGGQKVNFYYVKLVKLNK
jgi:hypothetical protein